MINVGADLRVRPIETKKLGAAHKKQSNRADT